MSYRNVHKGDHVIEIERHPQPWPDKPLWEARAPDGFKWEGDTYSLHGDSYKDLRERVQSNDLIEDDEQ